MSIYIVPDCKCKPIVADLLAAMKSCRPIIEELGSVSGYGYYRPANPHDFHPDSELCSAEEITAHKVACEAFDNGEYTLEKGSEWVAPNLHILRAPWGIGGYTDTDPACKKLLDEIDAAIARAEGGAK